MNFRHIMFLLVYFIVSITISSTSDEEVPEINTITSSESQIELPPLNIATADNPASNVADRMNNDELVNPLNHVASDQTENDSGGGVVVNENEKKHVETEEKSDDENSSSKEINKSETIQENLTIPVFSEWTQQQIQEAEKKLVELTGNSTESNKDTKNETLAKHQIVKMRQKNYASPDCGAKILANNPEAQSSSSVLSDKDEYMLSPCTDRIWFVIELCDSIQAKRVELANFELFSSPLKSVSISVSNRFPTRDWTIAGHFDAKSERDIQVFELKDVTLFGKFVRVDLEYTNTEHYCPLSFFRIFGTSEIEAFEVDNEPNDNRINHIDDDEDYTQNNNKPKADSSKDNILNRAGAAVMSIVQKAAEVLKSNGNGAKQHEISSKKFQQNCMSLSHDIVCEICSTDERIMLDNIITCKNSALKDLLEPEVKEYLMNTVRCNSILGFDLKSDSIETSRNFIASILPEKYIAAMCNLVAGDQKSLPLRIEDISEITSKLISKKDEVSLKNVSGDSHVHCSNNQNNNSNDKIKDKTIETIQADDLDNLNTESSNTKVVESEEKSNVEVVGNNNTDDQNIFNHVERTPPYLEDSAEDLTPSVPVSIEKTPRSNTETQSTSEQPLEVKEVNKDPTLSKEEEKKPEIPQKIDSQPSSPKPIEIKNSKNNEPSHQQNNDQQKTDQIIEIKNNAPESVFLRLSNRIKVLEKNMTLSTQYLEELSRRYKKQIEDLQQAYSKLQLQYDNLNQNKKETDKRDIDEKKKLKEDIEELNKKSDFMEIVMIVLTSVLIFQIILIFVLFKRLSILKDAFVMNDYRTENVDSMLIMNSNNVNKSEQVNGNEKTRDATNNSNSNNNNNKKKSKRVRKISAPNILSQQRNGITTNGGQTGTLNRTSSVPMKVNELLENNLPKIEQSAMLEENDEILLSAFEDLKLNDIGYESKTTMTEINRDAVPKRIDYDFDDTTSTASVQTTEEHNSHNGNLSGNLVRRLSSPTFLKLKKTTALKVKNGKPPVINDKFKLKKAKSESPPNFKSSSHNIQSIQKSNSFEEDALKFRKNNSFKKLFKKLF